MAALNDLDLIDAKDENVRPGWFTLTCHCHAVCEVQDAVASLWTSKEALRPRRHPRGSYIYGKLSQQRVCHKVPPFASCPDQSPTSVASRSQHLAKLGYHQELDRRVGSRIMISPTSSFCDCTLKGHVPHARSLTLPHLAGKLRSSAPLASRWDACSRSSALVSSTCVRAPHLTPVRGPSQRPPACAFPEPLLTPRARAFPKDESIEPGNNSSEAHFSVSWHRSLASAGGDRCLLCGAS